MPANFADLDDSEDQPSAPRPAGSSGGPQPGDLFNGRFELIRVIGRGGHGTVWEARASGLPGPLALKLVPVSSGLQTDRMLREIAIVRDLRGPHFARVYDGDIARPYAYVAMELLDGEDLAARLDRVGKLAPAEVVRISEQLALGMTDAHRAGLVHRDLKPTNIFLSPAADGGETLKILDFGAAKLLTSSVRVTTSDTLLGVPQYAAPEQIKNAHKVDTRADVWSMGAILYRCLLGRRPFDGTGAALLAIVVARPHPPPSSIDAALPESVDRVFDRALAKAPADRFQDVASLHRAFVEALG